LGRLGVAVVCEEGHGGSLCGWGVVVRNDRVGTVARW
jgi:hypothetical protein